MCIWGIIEATIDRNECSGTFVLSGIDAAGMPACAAQRRRAARPATLISWPLAFSHVAARVDFIAERAAP